VTRPLRVGVIGVGALGRHHARHLAQLDGARLVAVTDIDEGRARSVAEELGTQSCGLDALLAKVDAVTVAVPKSACARWSAASRC
jgi:predicted dehydrogenase